MQHMGNIIPNCSTSETRAPRALAWDRPNIEVKWWMVLTWTSPGHPNSLLVKPVHINHLWHQDTGLKQQVDNSLVCWCQGWSIWTGMAINRGLVLRIEPVELNLSTSLYVFIALRITKLLFETSFMILRMVYMDRFETSILMSRTVYMNRFDNKWDWLPWTSSCQQTKPWKLGHIPQNLITSSETTNA